MKIVFRSLMSANQLYKNYNQYTAMFEYKKSELFADRYIRVSFS